MERIRRLGHGYAGITATVALVLALGLGGAYAAGKIGSNDIATSAVKSKHIKDGQVKAPDLAADVAVSSAKTADRANTANTATTADQANTATTAKTADRASNVLAASVVNGCTTTNGGTGPIAVGATAGGECNVTFPRSIADCAVTLGTLLDFPGGGETTYRKVSGNTVQVSRRDSGGGTPTAGAFSIAAICP